MAIRRPRAANELPRWPACWYVVARSRDLRRGAILSGTLGTRPYVVWRGRTQGELHAVGAHCPHMGAHLANGTVVGERLRCALHHFEMDGSGRMAGCAAKAKAFSIRERYGLVFCHPESNTDTPLPSPRSEDSLRWGASNWVDYQCGWQPIVVNGFDILHMQSVHGRILREEPTFEWTPHSLEFEYVSSIAGSSVSDRVMRWLSSDRIVARVQCFGGPVVVVESDLGRTKSVAVLGVLPSSDDRTRGVGAFAVRDGVFAGPALTVAKWLFTSFLRRDLAPLRNMKMTGAEPDSADRGVGAISAYLASVPEMDAPNLVEPVVRAG